MMGRAVSQFRDVERAAAYRPEGGQSPVMDAEAETCFSALSSGLFGVAFSGFIDR